MRDPNAMDLHKQTDRKPDWRAITDTVRKTNKI